MDGGNRKRLISNEMTWPNGLALDLIHKRIYWTDGGNQTIEYANLDGTGRTVLISKNNISRQLQNYGQMRFGLIYFLTQQMSTYHIRSAWKSTKTKYSGLIGKHSQFRQLTNTMAKSEGLWELACPISWTSEFFIKNELLAITGNSNNITAKKFMIF